MEEQKVEEKPETLETERKMELCPERNGAILTVKTKIFYPYKALAVLLKDKKDIIKNSEQLIKDGEEGLKVIENPRKLAQIREIQENLRYINMLDKKDTVRADIKTSKEKIKENNVYVEELEGVISKLTKPAGEKDGK